MDSNSLTVKIICYCIHVFFMLIISQNVTNYDIPINDDAIFRINLAWVDSIDELKQILETQQNRKIFLDLPINRTKPPNNRYTLDEIIKIIELYDNIAYFSHKMAISLNLYHRNMALVNFLRSFTLNQQNQPDLYNGD